MSAERQLKLLEQIEAVTIKQIDNSEKTLELSKSLAKDVSNKEVAKEIESLQSENDKLFQQAKDLLAQY